MSKKLAIKGHPTRGNEVIELLEMLGGKNTYGFDGERELLYFFDTDSSDNIIVWDYLINLEHNGKAFEMMIFTLEEFLDKFPFKVGDFVRIPEYESEVCILKMKWCPLSKHIEYLVCPNDDEEWFTADELLEDNDNPNKMRDCKKCGLHFGSVRCFDKDCPHNTPKNKEEKQVNGMKNVLAELFEHIKTTPKEELEREFEEIKEWSNVGPTVEKFMTFCESVNKKPVYPKTYDECCKNVLGLIHWGMTVDVPMHYSPLILNFTKLLICRDAYWKIAGKELELGEPWKPKFGKTVLYDISFYLYQNNLVLHKGEYPNSDICILVFPTEEMRDTFYENFKDLIEQCKELL